MRKVLGRLLLIAAWFVVVSALVLFVLEESGVLTDLVRRQVALRLGALGEGLEIEKVRLRWFEPGVEIEGVSLRGPTSSGEGDDGRILYLRSVHVSLVRDMNFARPLRRLRIDGGRLLVSDALLVSLGRYAEGPGQGGTGRFLELRPPPFVLTDFEVDLALPDGEIVELGLVTLVAEPGPEGYSIIGELTPTLGGVIPDPVPIHIEGRQDADGVDLRATVRDLSFVALGPAIPAYFGALPVEEAAGSLSVASEGRIAWNPAPQVQGRARVSVHRGRLRPHRGDPPVENLELELDAAFDHVPGGHLWAREAWSARAKVQGDWRGASLLSFGEFGRDVPDGDWAALWGRIEEFPLTADLPETLRLGDEVRRTWDALAPEGIVDASFDAALAVPERRGDVLRWDPRVLVRMRHTGRSSITYHGWLEPNGERFGFPIPARAIRGDVVCTVDPEANQSVIAALIGINAEHGSGQAYARGSICSPPRDSGFPYAELDLRLTVPEMAIGEEMRLGLEGSTETSSIWPEFLPRGGTGSTEWHLRSSAATGGTTAWGEVVVHGSSMLWNQLPVPLENVDGRMVFSWGSDAIVVTDGGPEATYRPFGMTYRFSNLDAEGERRGAQAEAIGFVRTETPDVDRLTLAELPQIPVQELTVRIPDLLLRGGDWEILAEQFPDAGTQVRELGAKGAMEVRFRGGRPDPRSAYTSTLEASPRITELTPMHFPRRTRDLRGRLLVTMVEPLPGEGAEEEEVEADTLFAVSGSWPQGVELAAFGAFPATGAARLEIFGAGVDPTNTAFKGALAALIAAESEAASEGIDLSESSIRGHLDFASRADFPTGDPEVGETAYRIFLRGNELENGSLRLGDLRGVLEQRDEQWLSPRIEASIAGHPLELRDVRIISLGDAAQNPDADPLLSRPGFWSDPEGFALQAELHVRDLDADREHLQSLVDEESLALLGEDADWEGKIDVEGARILVTSEADGGGKVAMRGRVRPHDLAVRIGIPVEVEGADLRIEELIFEQGAVRGWGEIEDLDARIAGRELTDARMILGYVDGRLTIDNLAGDFGGGRLVSLGGTGPGSRKALGIDLSPPYRFDVAVRLRNGQLDRLLRGVFPSTIADQGVVDVDLQVSGSPEDVLGCTGGGWVRLEEGRLWSIPVMRELFQRLGFDQTAVFDRVRARFQMHDGVIETERMEIKSALVNLVGDGRLDLDGALHYDLELHYSLLDRVAGLNRILYWLNNSLWSVSVRGDMARPRVRIKNSLLDFLGRHRDPPRSLPLPAFAPLPPRF